MRKRNDCSVKYSEVVLQYHSILGRLIEKELMQDRIMNVMKDHHLILFQPTN